MEQKIMIAKDINLVEDGIFVNGIKITSSKDWNKVVEESIPKQVIRDKIEELKAKYNLGDDYWQYDYDVDMNTIDILKELLGE